MKLFAIKKFLISNHTCLTVTGLESALKKDKKSRKNKLLTEYEIILNVHSEQDLTSILMQNAGITRYALF